MTERGVSVREATVHTDPSVFFAALDLYQQYDEKLRAAAIWSRLNDPSIGAPGRILDPRVLDGLAERGIRPYIHAESYQRYEQIRAGMFDDDLRAWGRALKGRGAWFGWDHEMNGGTVEDPFFPWQEETVQSYRQTSRYVHDLLRDEAPDLMMVFSPAIRGKRTVTADILPFFDPKAWEVVGWTAYQRGERRPLRVQWEGMLGFYENIAPGYPVCVTECGRLKGLDERLEYAKDLHNVRGVDLIIAFDMDLESPAHRWRFTARQRRAYMTGA